jgi:hypothetical protein
MMGIDSIDEIAPDGGSATTSEAAGTRGAAGRDVRNSYNNTDGNCPATRSIADLLRPRTTHAES